MFGSNPTKSKLRMKLDEHPAPDATHHRVSGVEAGPHEGAVARKLRVHSSPVPAPAGGAPSTPGAKRKKIADALGAL